MTDLKVKIWRGEEEGEFQSYNVPARENQTILDVVTEVQRHQDPDLSYRFACRVGVCGSCAMTVNGKPRWTCRTHVNAVADKGEITIEPLRNMPVIKDLTCDMTDFFEKWQKAGGKFDGTITRKQKVVTLPPADPKRQNANEAIECINCAVCYAACDTVNWNEDYVGPAALNRAWTIVNDERASNRKEVFSKAVSDGGCNACHSQGNCTAACPVGLSPAQSIHGLKRLSLLSFLGKEI